MEILTVAINKNSGALRFANKSLLNEKDWAKISLLANGISLEKFPQFNEDKEFVKIALDNNKWLIVMLNKN